MSDDEIIHEDYYVPHCDKCGWIDTTRLYTPDEVDQAALFASGETSLWTCALCGRPIVEFASIGEEDLLRFLDSRPPPDKDE